MVNELHLVSFNVPYPADYGGVIDVFYKIKALSKAGIKVHLHTFQYGREEAPILNSICESVTYYKRKLYKDPFFSKLPYIVATRANEDLLNNLNKDNAPILFEGVHCCYYLDHPSLKDRIKIVRMHNIEQIYYKNLAKIERNFFKKYFFFKESERLRKFQKTLQNADLIAAISPDDEKILRLKFENVFFLPPFHANEETGPGLIEEDYALYHGNLGVGENTEAALYLAREVFNDIDYPLIIAGNNASKELRETIGLYPNVKLIDHISTHEIDSLINKAKINVLPTFQGTGMKLKLINVLFKGRFCIVNRKMIHHTGLEPLCIEANTPIAMKQAILKTSTMEFSKEDIEMRRKFLAKSFNNAEGVKTLMERIHQLTSVSI